MGGFLFLVYKLPFLEACIFGALISSTDPVSVLAIFQASSSQGVSLHPGLLQLLQAVQGGKAWCSMVQRGAVWCLRIPCPYGVEGMLS